jgi:hypothetical protein
VNVILVVDREAVRLINVDQAMQRWCADVHVVMATLEVVRVRVVEKHPVRAACGATDVEIHVCVGSRLVDVARVDLPPVVGLGCASDRKQCGRYWGVRR